MWLSLSLSLGLSIVLKTWLTRISKNGSTHAQPTTNYRLAIKMAQMLLVFSLAMLWDPSTQSVSEGLWLTRCAMLALVIQWSLSSIVYDHLDLIFTQYQQRLLSSHAMGAGLGMPITISTQLPLGTKPLVFALTVNTWQPWHGLQTQLAPTKHKARAMLDGLKNQPVSCIGQYFYSVEFLLLPIVTPIASTQLVALLGLITGSMMGRLVYRKRSHFSQEPLFILYCLKTALMILGWLVLMTTDQAWLIQVIALAQFINSLICKINKAV